MYWTAIIITSLLLLAYCVLILVYRHWFLQLPAYQAPAERRPATRFSVIIPARNEAENITACLGSVLAQSYPEDLFEVIFINDHSTDATGAMVKELQQLHRNLVLINLEDELQGAELNSYKKKAIELAIGRSRGDWIVATDADCMVPPNWLSTLDARIKDSKAVFVAAPVMFTGDESFLAVFQQLDFLSLQGITAASVSAGYHTMCNGANIAYAKEAFYAVNGFRGIDQLASGDDMLLMHKFQERYPGGIQYLFSTDAIVRTAPMSNWKDFLNQRIRWASKADKYNDRSIFWVLLLVYLLNLALLALLIVSPFVQDGFMNWLLLVIAKTLVELSFLIPVARFYGAARLLIWFPLMQPFHIVYTVMAGWLGKFGTYHWKGRKVK
jgi:cellulose synthase/poly-beta-1,6-N-acetylglucosamine synthase-like glycosyltransferase